MTSWLIYHSRNLGNKHAHAHLEGNLLKFIDLYGLETCLLTTVSRSGFRDHAAIYTSRGDGSGGPAIYDPAGAYGSMNGGGSSGLVSGEAANLDRFKEFHSPQGVESTCKRTSQDEEERIINQASYLPSAAPGQCAVMSSWALDGQPSFPHVNGGTWFPGNLMRDFSR